MNGERLTMNGERLMVTGRRMRLRGMLACVLLCVVLLCGCENRPLTYGQQTGIPFRLSLDWSALEEGEETPRYLKALFFPVDGGEAVERFVDPDGGEIYVPRGEYRVIVYNWRTNSETQTVQFRGDTYDTFEAYVTPRNGTTANRGEETLPVLPPPDKQLYGWNTGDATVIISETSPTVRTRSGSGDALEAAMSPLVHNYVVAVSVANAQYLDGILAVATDAYGSSLLGGGSNPGGARYAMQTHIERGGMVNGVQTYYCRVTTFGFFEDSKKTLVLDLANTSGETQREEVDITESVGRVDMGEAPADEPQVAVPPEVPIVVPVPDTPPGGSSGGFAPPGLSEWDEIHKDIFM